MRMANGQAAAKPTPNKRKPMARINNVSAAITPEAVDRLVELGFQQEFEQMITPVRAVVPELATIELAPLSKFATLHLAQDASDEAVVILSLLDAVESDPVRRRHRRISTLIHANRRRLRQDAVAASGIDS
jgi:hypothetical protein